MKTSLVYQLLGLFLLLTFQSFSAVISPVVNNGDWSEASTWNLGRIPGDLDIVNIPEGITVNITTNLYNAVPRQPDLSINVYGVLNLVGGGGQINIGCGSRICVINNGVIPSTGCNCNQINIGAGGAEWKGMHDASITGGNCITGSCFLPVTLISFTGEATSSGNELKWTSSEEVNFSVYLVERSVDGINFSEIASLSGSAEDGKGSSYSYLDHSVNSYSVYYRLKMVDKDNSIAYSKVVSVQKKEVVFSIYPNPCAAGAFLKLTIAETAETLVYLKDLSGKLISSLSYNGEYSGVSIPSDIKAGVYIVQVVSESFTGSSTLIIR